MADNTPPPPMSTTTPPRERETVIDDRVVALRGMFPDFDDAILQSVLDSAGGNQDRAIDILLGMTDPSFKSESEPIAPQPAPPVLSQTDLDEQFARQLVMQEQQQQNQLWLQSNADQTRPPPGVYHSSRTYNQSPQQQGAAERPSEFQEQVTKIAESGKKTFANIFSKVKAKIQEFETGRPSGSSSSPSSGSAPYPPYTTHPSQQYQQPQPQTWSQPQSQAAYFDPNPTSSTPPNASNTSPPPTSKSTSTPPVQGYDVGVSSTPPTTTATTTTTQLQREPSPQLLSTATGATPSQGAPASTTNPPIDAGKLGLMPKRPVSLIRDPAAAGAAGGIVGAGAAAHLLDDDDDNDGLEYAENPFDDEHGHGDAGKK